MVLIFSTPLNLGFESSCTERRLCPQSFLLPPSSISEAQPQAFRDKGPGCGVRECGRRETGSWEELLESWGSEEERQSQGEEHGPLAGEQVSRRDWWEILASRTKGLGDPWSCHLIKICNDLIEQPQTL